MNRLFLSAAALGVALAGCATGEAGTTGAGMAATTKGPAAHANLVGADGSARGMAHVTASANGLDVHVEATGVPAGVHGIHIHTVGRCDGPDFQTAGGHWNPTSRAHGTENPQGAHSGDLPNITIGADGRGMLHFSVPGATLEGQGASLLDADGAAVVIHANADDYRTDPSGNSGGRIACGVLTKM